MTGNLSGTRPDPSATLTERISPVTTNAIPC